MMPELAQIVLGGIIAVIAWATWLGIALHRK